jgi:tRNA(fMet)-specific endonuclease VapC
MTHSLDTDHISIMERQGAEYPVILANIAPHGDDDVGVSVVSVQEQARGCLNLINQAVTPAQLLRAYDLLFRVIDFFRDFPLVPFDASALAEYDRLNALKLRVKTMDLRIASVALARDLTLVSRNLSDFGKVPGLKVEDWTK